MELNGDGFLEELLALRRDAWETNIPNGMSDFLSNNGWTFDYCFNEIHSTVSALPTCSFDEFSMPLQHGFDCGLSEMYPCGFDTTQFQTNEEHRFSTMEDEEAIRSFDMEAMCKVEPVQSTEAPVFNMGLCTERKSRIKKVEGQPSKNLMAERRRRKRLNDRLLMLRSVVPKISKMDRTSILGDTIDYMKELIERINNLREEIEPGSNPLSEMNIFNDIKPNEILVRNSPKFDVERRNDDTRIEVCCTAKPGLLLSTVTTLEALGLEIQQCVISCFNDFSVQASCSEGLEQRTVINSEDIKQALYRNAGYGGRCL